MGLAGILLGISIGFWQKHSPRDPLAKLFPEEKLRGRVEGARVSIVSDLSSKSIGGGDVLLARVILPFHVDANRLDPTSLGILQGVLRQQPNTDWICIFIAEDSALAATSNWVSIAEYHRGEITLRGGHPSPVQIDSLQSLGIPAHRPDSAEAALVNETFVAHPGLRAARWKLSQTLRGATSASLNQEEFFKLELDTRTLFDVEKKHGMTGEQLRQKILGVVRYYWLRMGEAREP
jgi:hypothetical protein